MLALKHAPRKPALVVFYDGTPDAFAPFETDKGDVHANFERIREQVEKARGKKGGFAYFTETNTGRLLTAVLSELRRRQAMGSAPATPVPNLEAMARVTATNYLENMRVVQGLSRAYGFRYVSIWAPTIFLGHKPLSKEERALLKLYDTETPGEGELFRETYDALFSKGDQHIVDAEGMFDQTDESLYLDIAHTGSRGNRIAANRIFEILHERGLLQE
jgi:hypothetical protein